MMEKRQSFSFSLQKIMTEQFLIVENKNVITESVKLETKLKFGLNEENLTLVIFPKFKFSDANSPFLSIEIGCYFQLTEETWKIFDKQNLIIFPKSFIRHLSAISIGVTRGVLHAKTENTIYNKYLLPTININELVSNDIELKITKAISD